MQFRALVLCLRYAALSVIATCCGSAGVRAAVLTRVPAAREMAVCGDALFVGTKGRSVYEAPVSGGAAHPVAGGFSAPNGVACAGGRLFVASRDGVFSFTIGKGGALGRKSEVRRGLPNSGVHSLRYLAVGPDGRLYLSLGSPCNICMPQGLQGTIVSMKQDGSDLVRVAFGVRNSVGFDWRDGAMYFTDNGADGMGDNIPPDELNLAQQGAFYGFPYFGGRIRLKGYGRAAPPQPQTPPVFEFQAHVAALGLHFFRSLGGDALVAEHGSWNRSVPDGRQVVRVHFESGRPAAVQSFAHGLGRPVDVKEAPDGGVLVSDDSGGAIYKLGK